MQGIENNFLPKSLIYEDINKTPIKQENWCFSIAINNENSLMLVGCGNWIKVYQVKQEKVRLIHYYLTPNRVIFVIFFKFNFLFASSSEDNSIIIWSPYLNQKSKFLMKLRGHSKNIQCLVLHPIDDQMLITGSYDSKIKFWSCYNKSNILSGNCLQTISEHTSHVYGLSINQNGNKLISCGLDNLILVMERINQDSHWSVKQRIKVIRYGFRIAFVSDLVLVFLPQSSSHLKIYTLNPIDNEYSNSEDVVIDGGNSFCNHYFPIQYCQQKKLMLIKNGNCLNFVRVILPFKDNNNTQKVEIISISRYIFKMRKAQIFVIIKFMVHQVMMEIIQYFGQNQRMKFKYQSILRILSDILIIKKIVYVYNIKIILINKF
ncbi:unnamed protein product [Paramecium pentaurelia]|uniref:Uncharacterized protein n=1 Tax=Paramecium pentaurelia TaxID=43138 RepID=A0A8S1YIV1_9CILI|nr:unnamed protein product [Paramecium pentaurelia]